MCKKEKLIEKVKKLNDKFSDDQAVQIANFLISLSEVYYENSSKSNPSKKAA